MERSLDLHFRKGLADNLQRGVNQLLPGQQFPSLSQTLFSARLGSYLRLRKSHSLNALFEVSAGARKERGIPITRFVTMTGAIALKWYFLKVLRGHCHFSRCPQCTLYPGPIYTKKDG